MIKAASMDVTWPLSYDAFVPPSKKEVSKWKCSPNISPPQLTPPSSPRSPARHSTADELTLTESDSESDYLKLQAENIKEKEKLLTEMGIPEAAAAAKKRPRKRPRKATTTTTTVPRKSARIAAKSSNRDEGGQDQERADAGGLREPGEPHAEGGDQDANDDLRGAAVSPDGGGQDTGAPSGQHPIPGSLVADYDSGNDTSMD